MRAFILCGGFGTRLRTVIGDNQKAVSAVNGRPFLWSVIDELLDAGLSDLVFCTHFQSPQVEEALSHFPRKFNASMRLVRELTPLGTAGAVIQAVAEIGYAGPLMVLNGDTYIAAYGYAELSRKAAPGILVTSVDDCARYGAIRIDATGRVIGLTEKGVTGPGLISAGVYALHTDQLLGYASGPLSIEKDMLPKLITEGNLSAAHYQGPFIDIGTPDSLQQIRSVGVQGIK